MTLRQKVTPWRNLIGAFLLLGVSLGMNTAGLSMFYLPVTEELGFTQAQFSLYFTLTTLACGAMMPFAGRIISKSGDKLRWLLMICLLINGACLYLYSLCSTLPQFYALSVVRGLVFALDSGLPATVIANTWFEDRRQLAVSIVFSGSMIGGIAFNSLGSFLIDSTGWRSAYAILGVIAAAIGVLMLLLITKMPESMGLEPYRTGKEIKLAVPSTAHEGFTLKQAMRRPEFWLYCIGIFLMNIAAMAAMQNIGNSLVRDYARSTTFASNMMNIKQVFCIVGTLAVGWLLDRVGFKKFVCLLCGLYMAAMVCMLNAWSVPLTIGFAVMFGLGDCVTSTVVSGLTSDVFGLKDYSSIYGMVSAFLMVGMSLGPIIAGLIYDYTGSYTAVWYMAIVLIATFIPATLIPYIRRHSGRLAPPKEENIAK